MKNLAALLKTARQHKGASLRQVEVATGISNSYLCQLEAGKDVKPSPEKLYKLAEFYKISYETLMEATGYVVPNFNNSERANLSAHKRFLLDQEMTEDEAETLSKYLKFIRDTQKT